LKSIRDRIYRLIDSYYIGLDKSHVRRTKNILRIPSEDNRGGGKYSYAEWAHVIGLFQSLLYVHLDRKEDNHILDVGCGSGLLGIAAEPYLGENGRYIGIDVVKENIDFCSAHYDSPKFSFEHLNAHNPLYTRDQESKGLKWNIEDGSLDMVLALSVWTHFSEEDAAYYFSEVERVLKPGARAMITFFLLDEEYERTLPLRRKNETGRYHMTEQELWVFDRKSYDSDHWLHPKWAGVPEEAIGLTTEGLNRLMSGTSLEKTDHYQGNWKEIPGVFFQDIVVFRKS